ncbi:MAG: hypothetical protein NW208_13375 [Bryobacter sp.]|nr:hypothetical protein [Bryobacter sp.]
MRIVVALFFACSYLSAQLVPLAASQDGELVLFGTDWVLPHEPLLNPTSRVFLHRSTTPQSNAPQLFYTPEREGSIQGVFVSEDASTEAIVVDYPRSGGISFGPVFVSGEIFITRRGELRRFQQNRFAVSPNGRFVYYGSQIRGPHEPRVEDLDSGEIRTYDFLDSPAHPVQALANDGSLLSYCTSPASPVQCEQSRHVWLARPGLEPVRIFASPKHLSAAITRDGSRTFVLHQPIAGTWELVEAFGNGAASRVLYQSNEEILSFQVDSTGNRFLLQMEQSILCFDATRSELKHVFSHTEGIGEMWASKDLDKLLIRTRLGRIGRYSVSTNRFEDLYPALPSRLFQLDAGAVAGSLLRIQNEFPEEAVLRVEGTKFPLVRTSKEFSEFQVPWEFPGQSGPGTPSSFRVSRPDSPFEATGRLRLPPGVSPFLISSEPGTILAAAQQDFTSVVSLANPALRGSLIHAYAFGLGPTDIPLATGEPGPSNPPARPLAPFACTLRTDDSTPLLRGVELPTIIYAPGLIGVYQIDVRIPADWPSGISNLICTHDNQNFTRARVPIR